MQESVPPTPIHPTDKHPELPPTSHELDMADSDPRVRDEREREEAANALPPLTDEEKQLGAEQAKRILDKLKNS